MSKGRNQSNTVWQHSQPIYLDTAFKQLLRQQHKSKAIKNRTKVLELNQDHILKQVQINQERHSKLQQIKMNHNQETQFLQRQKQKKQLRMEELKNQNLIKRTSHMKQMNNIYSQKDNQIDKIRESALKMRKENHKIIQANREKQLFLKKEIHNKIHQDIVESRSTIKNFFVNKHDMIVQATQQQIKKLNQRRLQEQSSSIDCSGKIIESLQHSIQSMRNSLVVFKSGQLIRRQSNSLSKKKQVKELHPLVKKIDSVMSRYTKFL